MARASKNADISSKNARKSLAIQSEPHWYSIGTGQHLGYRKTDKAKGNWIVRFYSKEHGRRFASLGIADDSPADMGSNELRFQQAIDAARAEIAKMMRADSAQVKHDSVYTIKQAMADYLKDRERVRRKELSRTRSVVETHILPTLGKIELAKLTAGKVKGWRDSLAEQAPKIRNKPGVTGSTRTIELSDPDVARKRQATANRIFTVLRAALNHAFKEGHVSSKGAWERVTPFREVDVPRVQYLSVDECKRLIAACPPDFREMVRAALYTGCRYGELTALTVDAYNPDSRTLHIRRSKSGKDRHIPVTEEGAAFFASVAGDRKGSEPLFIHANGPRQDEAWEATQQRYWMIIACDNAEIEPAASFHILRHTYASQLAMNGTPMPVIASLLGHADTRMTEKHYGHLAPSYIADTLRANLPSFGFESSTLGPRLVERAG